MSDSRAAKQAALQQAALALMAEGLAPSVRRLQGYLKAHELPGATASTQTIDQGIAAFYQTLAGRMALPLAVEQATVALWQAAQAAAAEAYQQERTRWQEERRAWQAEREAWELERQEGAAAQAQWQAQAAQTAQALVAMTDERDQLAVALATAQQAHDQQRAAYEHLAGEQRALKASVEALTTRHDREREQLLVRIDQARTDERKRGQAQIDRLEQQLASVQQRLAAREQALTEAKQQLSAAAQTQVTLAAQCSALEQRDQERQREQQALRDRHDAALATLRQQHEAALAEQRQHHEAAQGRVAADRLALQQAYDQLRTDYAQLKGQVEVLAPLVEAWTAKEERGQ